MPPAKKKADPFYKSQEWEAVRYLALKRDRWYCQECGVLARGPKYKEPIADVDHIEPRKEHPEKALKLSNLQVLCRPCHSRRTIRATFGTEPPKIGYDGFIID